MTNERMGLTANWIVVGQAVKRLVNSHIVFAHTHSHWSWFSVHLAKSWFRLTCYRNRCSWQCQNALHHLVLIDLKIGRQTKLVDACDAAALHWMGRNHCGTRRQWHEPMKKANTEEEEEEGKTTKNARDRAKWLCVRVLYYSISNTKTVI